MAHVDFIGGSYQERAARAQASWPAVLRGLPIGTEVRGTVIDKQPFGVFVDIDGHPHALGLAEITVLPQGAALPPVGAEIEGVVIWHATHNHQVKLRLTGPPVAVESPQSPTSKAVQQRSTAVDETAPDREEPQQPA